MGIRGGGGFGGIWTATFDEPMTTACAELSCRIPSLTHVQMKTSNKKRNNTKKSKNTHNNNSNNSNNSSKDNNNNNNNNSKTNTCRLAPRRFSPCPRTAPDRRSGDPERATLFKERSVTASPVGRRPWDS